MIQLAFDGLCMAVADSVPGVSGGTIAFILGFYDRFINALHDLFGKEAASRKTALCFLLKLGIGWAIGMGACALMLSDLFEKHIYFMSSVFLGLTAASIPFVIAAEKEALRSSRKNVVFTVFGAALVVGLSLLRSGSLGNIQFSDLRMLQIAYIFFSGAVAIVAMVLPGISGSTVLLIAGVYLPTVNAIKDLLHFQLAGLPGLMALGFGVLFGAGISIHFIRSALEKHRSAMDYLILGLMLGSLFAIVRGPMTLSEHLPAVDLSTFRFGGFAAGILILLGLESFRIKKSTTKTVPSGAVVLVRGLILDMVLAAVIVGTDYFFSYQLPRVLPSLNQSTVEASADWSKNFQDHFSDIVISTDTVYKSPNISIELTQKTYDSGIDDPDGEYGTIVTYTLADIYVSKIDCLRTAFAQDAYGIGFQEKPQAMSERMNAVLSVNGDSYSKDNQLDNGTVIRNGIIYREQKSSEETCVLFRDGTMKIYTPDSFHAEKVIRKGAWQTWVFGPSLLDENGNAKFDFSTSDYIDQSHPRTAIGYYEPGHYCLLVADGRQKDFARGMYLEEMSQLFADLGCKAAYNLDGGHSSFMLKDEDVVSHPYKLCKDLTDGILICEPEV